MDWICYLGQKEEVNQKPRSRKEEAECKMTPEIIYLKEMGVEKREKGNCLHLEELRERLKILEQQSFIIAV